MRAGQSTLAADRPTGLDLVIRAAPALASGKWLSVFVVGVNPYDRLMLAAATGLLAAVVARAAYCPARRAARVWGHGLHGTNGAPRSGSSCGDSSHRHEPGRTLL